MSGIDWDDPAARAGLIERVGVAEYNRLHAQHRRDNIVATVNGYDIRPVNSRFGRIFMVDGSGKAFAEQAEAEAHARSLPAWPVVEAGKS